MDILTLSLAVQKTLRELGIDKENKKTTYSGELTTQGERSMYIAEGRLFNLVVGATCTVALDGGTYTEVVKADESGVLYIGDPGVGNGKSYSVGEYMIDDENWQSMVVDHNNGAKFTVTTETETIHPIDQKYLPDLTGRAGTIKTEKTVILPETTAENAVNDMYAFPYVNLTVGEIYMVKLNGEVYRTECFDMDGDIAIGNRAEVNGGISTGEPFVYVLAENGEYAVCMVFNPDTFEPLPYDSITLEIYQETEVAQPIEPRFIPAMDYIILNGADGKHYKVTVSNGALSVDEVV
jgi:hypothetical protein